MKKYRCKVYWEMCGEVEVEAPTKKSAYTMAMDAKLPTGKGIEYVPDSFNIDPMDVVEIK